MPICILCLREFAELTDEHVFPASLGGNLVVPKSVCAADNNGSSKFEQLVASELAPLRFLLLIPDRYGRLPAVAAKAEMGGKEHDARLLPDGKLQLKPIFSAVIGTDGVKEIFCQYLTDRQREEKRREAKEKGYQLIESEASPEDQAEVHVSGTLRIIGSPEGLRTAAKIAYTGFAFRMGRGFAMGESFDEIRTYIRTGEGHPRARLFINEVFLDACQQGPHQHSLVIAGRHDKNRVDAIVRLFGGLCYFVVLSDHYAGADFYDTLVFDAQRGEVNKALVVHEQAEFLQIEDVGTSSATVWNDLVASGEWFLRFLDSEIRSYFERMKRQQPKI